MASERQRPARWAARRAALLCVLIGTLVVFLMPGVAEAGGPTFSLKPATPTETGWFVLSGRPGQTLRGQVVVTNVGGGTGSTRLYAVDATTGETSGAVYLARGKPRRGVGRWISLGNASLTLGPGESKTVPFSVRVPAEAAAGEYLGGLVTQRYNKNVTPPAAGGGGEEGGFHIKIHALSVLAVQVNVPGPRRPAMALTGIKPGGTPGHQALELGMQNTGNVFVKGKGNLRVVDSGGRQVQRQQFALDTFLPDTRIDFPVYVQGKALDPGEYKGTVTVEYAGRRVRRTFPFKVTSAQVEQVYGTTAASVGPASSSGGGGDDTAVIILAAVAAVSIGTAGFFFIRNRRLA